MIKRLTDLRGTTGFGDIFLCFSTVISSLCYTPVILEQILTM